MTNRTWLIGAAAVITAGVIAWASAAGAFGGHASSGSRASADGYGTTTAAVIRRSLTSQTELNASLGDSGTWTVTVPQLSASAPATATGTFTWLPRPGQTIRQGRAAYKVNDLPVVLLYGAVPAYRDLLEGVTGPDVSELNTDLVKLGYLTSAGPERDYFSAETAYGVEQLQLRLGLPETGILSLGEALFLPGPALITGLGTGTSLGGPAAPGQIALTASSTEPVVTVDLDAGLQSEVKIGDQVSVDLPDGDTAPGTVSAVERVASPAPSSGSGSSSSSGSSDDSSPATITVLVTLKNPKAAGKLNQVPVTVTITTGSVSDVLVVPVNALLAKPGGDFAVEVSSGPAHHLVTVRPGIFDDAAGLVAVTGNLAAGQRVVVPGL